MLAPQAFGLLGNAVDVEHHKRSSYATYIATNHVKNGVQQISSVNRAAVGGVAVPYVCVHMCLNVMHCMTADSSVLDVKARPSKTLDIWERGRGLSSSSEIEVLSNHALLLGIRKCHCSWGGGWVSMFPQQQKCCGTFTPNKFVSL